MLFERLGHFVFRHRRAVILAWVVIIIIGAVLASGVSGVLGYGGYFTSGEADEGATILEEELGIRRNAMTVVFSSETLRANDPLFMDEMDRALAGLQDIEDLDPPITYRSTGDPRLISADGHTTYAAIGVDGDLYRASELVPNFREKLQPQPHLTMVVTGPPPFGYDAEVAAMSGMGKAERFTFPLVAIILLLAFGSLVAAGLPLAIGGASIVLAMALVFLLGQFTDMTSSCMAPITFIGLGISIDFSLIMVTRFREELKRGKDVENSVATTVATAGRAIFYSSVTSMIGFAAIITVNLPVLRSWGIGALLVVLLALVVGLTLVPALLAILGPRINRLTLFRLPEREGTFWQRLARWEMKHPVVVLLLVIPFLGLLIWPVAGLQLSGTSYAAIPEDIPARQGYEILREGFGAGEVAPIMVAVTTRGAILDPDEVGALYDFTREVARNEEVSRVESIVNLDPAITREQYQLMYASPDSIPDPRIKDAVDELTSDQATLVLAYTKSDPLGQEAIDLVTYIRNLEPGGLDTYVTGHTATTKEVVDRVYDSLPWVLLFIMVSSYLVLLWLFKSVLLPLKAILLNAAGVAAAFGILVFIFQEGNFSGLLNFTAVGSLDATLFVMIFGVTFGLSMDYEVFLLTRVKEEWVKTGDNTRSVALGLARTGRVITSAALIMAVVFASIAARDLLMMKILGLGVALAILIDAAIIRVFLAPVLMRIMGKWNWWAPAFLERLWTPRGRNSDKDS